MIAIRILLTLAALEYGFSPLVMDLSSSHVLNDAWPPHARFHVVWLIGVLLLLAIISIGASWRPSSNPTVSLQLALIPGWIALLPFFAAAVLLPAYGGSFADDPSAPQIMGINGNVFAFSIAAALQAVATFMTLRLR